MQAPLFRLEATHRVRSQIDYRARHRVRMRDGGCVLREEVPRSRFRLRLRVRASWPTRPSARQARTGCRGVSRRGIQSLGRAPRGSVRQACPVGAPLFRHLLGRAPAASLGERGKLTTGQLLYMRYTRRPGTRAVTTTPAGKRSEPGACSSKEQGPDLLFAADGRRVISNLAAETVVATYCARRCAISKVVRVAVNADVTCGDLTLAWWRSRRLRFA